MSFTESHKKLHPENGEEPLDTYRRKPLTFVCTWSPSVKLTVIILQKADVVSVFLSGFVPKAWVPLPANPPAVNSSCSESWWRVVRWPEASLLSWSCARGAVLEGAGGRAEVCGCELRCRPLLSSFTLGCDLGCLPIPGREEQGGTSPGDIISANKREQRLAWVRAGTEAIYSSRFISNLETI